MPCCASTTLRLALRRQPLGEAPGELRRHVLHDEHRGIQSGRQPRHDLGQGARPAGRGRDRDAVAAPGPGARTAPAAGAPLRGRREHRQALDIGGARRAEHARCSRSAKRAVASAPRSSSLATRSTAPSSSARMAAAVPGPACALTTTIGARRLRHDVADRAEAIELRHLEVHQHQVGRVGVHLPERIHAVAGGGHDPELAAIRPRRR